MAKRLTNLNHGVASTRHWKIKVDSEVTPSYIEEMAEKIIRYYCKYSCNNMDWKQLVFGSVHRASLYLAECLNAPVLPVQFLGFSSDWNDADQFPWAMAGSDYNINKIDNLTWQ